MFARRVHAVTAWATAALLLLVASCTNAPPTPGGTTPFSPDDASFGASQPDRAVVEARPQTINPFAANASAQLPSSADLTKDLPPIGNQGQLGSCTAWASGYAAATYTARRSYGWDQTAQQHQASPGYLYERLLEEDNFDCGSGTFIQTAMNLLVQEGCSSFSTVSYTDQACFPDPSQSDAANFQIGSFNRVVETDRHAVRAELAAGRIVVIGAKLYDDFPQWQSTEVYTGSGTFLTSGSQHAAHAMACVGYDDARQAYRIMNSWSTDWGDGGYMWMSYQTFEATVFEAYAIEPAARREPPNPPGPGPDPQPGPDENPDAFLDEAYQFVDADPITREPEVYLVFFWHFSEPVYIRTITVTDPVGGQGQQTYEGWYLDGYVYFVQSGGFQWQPGVYTLEIDVQTEAGNDVLYTGEATIEGLDEGGEPGDGLCSDLCMFAFDGECDDGGPGSDYELCEFGTDCFDCGVRADDGGTDPLCNDTCRFAGDGECDDGGSNADFDVCDLGTDCTDCGPRQDGGGPEQVCSDACRFAFDGECDDGGPGADFDVCAYGTDCFDCGARDAALCFDTCPFAFDGECDDGGPGALTDVCDFGTDCGDCGARDAGTSKVTTRTFRGVEVKAPAWAKSLPAVGVREDTTLGANRQPVRVIHKAERAEKEQ